MTLIAQITDLHLRPRGMPALRVSETNMLAERAVDFLVHHDPRPDAVLITGDLADTGNPKEYETARAILDRLPMPVLAIPGNHDNAANMKAAYADQPCAQQMPGDALQFAVKIGELRIVGADTSVPGKPYGKLTDTELSWLADALAKDRTTPTLLALHHPPIRTGIHHMDRSMLREPERLEEIVAAADNILAILCGHQHRMISSTFGGKPMMVVPGVAHQVVFDLTPEGPSAFTFEPPAAMFHQWRDGKLVSHMAYIESFEGPYPFWPDKDQTWPGY